MKIMKDGKPFNGTITVDGYGFGDRLLEGLMLDLDVKEGIVQEDTFRCHKKIDEDYFAQFNREFWKKECLEYIKDDCGDMDEVNVEDIDILVEYKEIE